MSPTKPCEACLSEGRAVPSETVYRKRSLCFACACYECGEAFTSLPKYDPEVKPAWGKGTPSKRGGKYDVPLWAGNRQPASLDCVKGEPMTLRLYSCVVGDDGRAYLDETTVVSVPPGQTTSSILALFKEAAS